MQAPFDNIVQYLFHQPSLHSVTVDELENMAVQHPYFAAAHFLLLKKMQDTAHPKFISQLHKTTIYFNNPLWLQFLLQPETVDNFSVPEKPPFFVTGNLAAQTEPLKEEYKNVHATETVLHKDEPVAEEQAAETHPENVYANTNDTLENHSAQSVPSAENHGIMDVITEVFNDPNPLYNMVPAEPVNAITEEVHHETPVEEIHLTSEQEKPAITEQPSAFEEINTTYENEIQTHSTDTWVTPANNDIQPGVISHEENFVDQANTTPQEEVPMQSSDPWMRLANNAVHEEVVNQEENFIHPVNTIPQEQIPVQQSTYVTEQTNDIVYEQPAAEEMIAKPHEATTTQYPDTATNDADNTAGEKHEETHDAEKITEPVFETIHPNGHITEIQESTEPFKEQSIVQNPVENNIPLAIATETNNDETTAPEIISEQTGDAYINSALEADATEPVPEIISDHSYNGDAQLKIPEPNFIKTIIETPAAKNDLLFEPYHTVDYFASQGIKLSKMDADSKDRFGRQLKSFTEWLKIMKRHPQASIDKMLSENEEQKVVADANHSIENKDVITVAMAEVFEKQGMNEKAAEIYRKLSLLNPTKSTYFAARIEALKH